MPLVNMRDMLQHAHRQGYAVEAAAHRASVPVAGDRISIDFEDAKGK